MFRKIAIIGVGLIGGSIGLAARRRRLAKRIVGVCRHQQSLRKARQMGAIDQGSLNHQQAVKGADLVILAVPVRQMVKIVTKIIPNLEPGCLLTDVGSTKEEVVNQIEKVLPRKFHFVGSHPLAGSEKRGVSNASADLFKAAHCFVIKTSRTNPLAMKNLSQFWQKIGCRVKVLSNQEHDKIVASVSHLPHLAATQLVKVAKRDLKFVGSGFADTTRIASSDAEIWTDIFFSNKKFIIQAVDQYIAGLKFARGLISKEDKKRLSAEFKQAKSLRDAF